MSDTPPPQDPADLAREMTTASDEPLLPVEKHLILWSLVLGVGLLGVLYWVSATWFPVGAAPR